MPAELPGEISAMTRCNLLEAPSGCVIPVAGGKMPVSMRPHEIASWYCTVSGLGQGRKA